jgi:hypothetical protein
VMMKKYILFLYFLQKTKGEGFYFFFKIKQITLWSSIIGQNYFEQFEVISMSLKETKGKVRGKGKGSFDKVCQSLVQESEASCFYHLSQKNSGEKTYCDQWHPFFCYFTVIFHNSLNNQTK